ncbi:hypothetical protein NDU88_001805 [Pleurodeles waltl]|uniref:Chloride conductance regulatory protein ICln n=1 Tax=Pleurodeles waltl TaxID=8319 RepID=A0AAV7QB61_PLEWA|nr:hypothetical protein NDU88_001805 [Pleurodeles waltl]
MVNAKLGDDELKENYMGDNADESDSDYDIELITEIRFFPSDKSAFETVCECQALPQNPGEEDSDDDFEGEEHDVEAHTLWLGDIPTFYPYEEGLLRLTAEGQSTL